MANIKHVRSHTERSLTREATTRKRVRAEPDLDDATSHIKSTIPVSRYKKRSKPRKTPLIPAGRHAAFPSLEPGPSTTQLPPGRHDLLRLVDDLSRTEQYDTKKHRYALTRKSMGQHFGDAKISFRDLYPSIRQSIIDEICEDTVGVYKSDYTPVLRLLRIDERMLYTILKENCQVWNRDHPIAPHLVKLKLAFPDRAIDPDTPPTWEILKAMKFLEQEHLPGSLLGEWQFPLPILEELIVPPLQGTSIAALSDKVDAGVRTQSAKDLAQKTAQGLCSPERPGQPTRPQVSPITPVHAALVTSKGRNEKGRVDQETHQYFRSRGRPLRHDDGEQIKTLVGQASQTQMSGTMTSPRQIDSSNSYQRKTEKSLKSKSGNSVQSRSDGYHANSQWQASIAMGGPPLGRFPPPIIRKSEGLNAIVTRKDLPETLGSLPSWLKPPPQVMRTVPKKHGFFNPSRTSTPEQQQSSQQRTTPGAQSPAASVYAQKSQQSFSEYLGAFDLPRPSGSRALVATQLQSFPQLSQLPHIMSVPRQEPHMSPSNYHQSPHSHIQQNSPNRESHSPWRPQGSQRQNVPNDTAQRGYMLRMRLQETPSPTRRVSPQYDYQHGRLPSQTVSPHRTSPQQYHQRNQGQWPGIQSPSVYQTIQSSQIGQKPGPRQLQKSPIFATAGHLPQQGPPSSPGMQRLSGIYSSPPNMNILHSGPNQSSPPTAQSQFRHWLPPHYQAPLAKATPLPRRSQLSSTDPFFHPQSYTPSTLGGTHGPAYNIRTTDEHRHQPNSLQQPQSKYSDALVNPVVSQPPFVQTVLQNSASPVSPIPCPVYLSSPGELPDLPRTRQQHLSAPRPGSSDISGLIDPRLLPGFHETQSRIEKPFRSSAQDMNPNAMQGHIEVSSVKEINALKWPKKRERDSGLIFVEPKIKEGEGNI